MKVTQVKTSDLISTMSTTSGEKIAVLNKDHFFQERKHLRKDSGLYKTKRTSQEQTTDT